MPLPQTRAQLEQVAPFVTFEYWPVPHAAQARFAVADGDMYTCVPGPQSVHGWQMVSIEAVPLSDANEASAQTVCASHVAALVRLLNVPLLHAEQTRFAVADGDMYTCVPGPQSVHDWHSKLRLVSAYRPSGHASQLVEFSAEAAVPSAHSSQETDAVLCADVPLGHGVQLLCPSLICDWPVGQASHTCCPV